MSHSIVPSYSQINQPAIEIQSGNQPRRRMQISVQMCYLLKNMSYSIPDLEGLITRNMTPKMYWFMVDSLYFSKDIGQQYRTLMRHRLRNCGTIQDYQNYSQQNISSKTNLKNDQYNDSTSEYIYDLHKWVSEHKSGTLNQSDIKSTSIDQVIQIVQGKLENITYQIDCGFDWLVDRVIKVQNKYKRFMQKYEIEYLKAHPMFELEEAEEKICEQLIQQEIKSIGVPICYLCSLPKDLKQCKCGLKVHTACYPPLASKFSNTKNKKKNQTPENGILIKFECQNCRLNIDFENQKCELCCCVGGQFLPLNQTEEEQNVVLTLPNNYEVLGSKSTTHLQFHLSKSKQKRNRKFIHTTCFLWNQECEWNKITKQVDNINKIQRKKINAMCSLCGISYGAAIPCTNQTCRRFYHPQCARRKGLEMNLIKAKTSVIQLFCQRHRHFKGYQSIRESQMNKLRQVKKLFENTDKEIKRQNILPDQPIINYYGVKRIYNGPLNSEFSNCQDQCTACNKSGEIQKVKVCSRCKNWYHMKCSTYCKHCL